MSDIQQAVRDKYGAIATVGARDVDGHGGCCGPTACGCGDPITSNLYSDAETSGLPADAVTASLGCGNPTALLALEPGETVLDLGSGGGIDVLLSAKRVGPTGKAYGLDMTDEMLALARENQRKAGATNVEFLKGTIENIPLPDNSVDVIISNCVINLSSDKDAVLREAFRVLKPGGRFAVSDVVVRGEVPADVRRNMELWVGCIAGALEETEYVAKLHAAGFADVEVEPWRVYNVDDARAFLDRGRRRRRRDGAAGRGQVRQRVHPRAQAGGEELLRTGVLRLITRDVVVRVRAQRRPVADGRRLLQRARRPGEGTRDFRRHAAGGSREPGRRRGDARSRDRCVGRTAAASDAGARARRALADHDGLRRRMPRRTGREARRLAARRSGGQPLARVRAIRDEIRVAERPGDT